MALLLDRPHGAPPATEVVSAPTATALTAAPPPRDPSADRGGSRRRRGAGRGIVGGAALLSLGVAVQSASNVGFHAVTSRSLEGRGYVDLATLLACMMMLTVPLGALQAAFSRAIAGDPGGDRRRAVRGLWGAAAVVAALVGLAAAPLRSALDVSSLSATLLLAPFLAVSIVLAGHRGIGLGQRRFGLVAASFAIPAVLRLAFVAAFAPVAGLPGAVLATLLAEAVGLGIVALGLRRRRPAARSARHLDLGWRDVASTGVVVLGLWTLTGVDLLLARGLLGAEASTGYVAAGTIARTVMAVPVAIVMAALPSFTADGDGGRRALRKALALAAGAAGVGFLAVAAAPGLAQRLLFGEVLAPAGLTVSLAAVAVGGAMATTLTYFLLGQRRRGVLVPWFGAAIEIAAIASFHGSPTQIVAGSAVATLVTVSVMAVVARRPAVAAVDAPPELPIPSGPGTRLSSAADPNVDLSVVMPFYNPGASVGRTIARFGELARAAGVTYEVIAVSDGSTDGSEAHVAAVDDPAVRLVVLPHNQGKGAAVRHGFARARGGHVAFIDADGDIDPVHLLDHLERARRGGHDVVYASKRHPDARSDSSPARKVISRTFSLLVSSLFLLGVDDTQTGCKVFRRDVAADLMTQVRERRFALDLELFVVARRRGHRDLEPAPVHLGERLAGSTVTSAAVLRTLRDALTIWTRLHVTRAYAGMDAAAPQPVVTPARWTTWNLPADHRAA